MDYKARRDVVNILHAKMALKALTTKWKYSLL